MSQYLIALAVMVLGAALLGCADNNKATNDFQAVCTYFQELERQENVNSLTTEERNKFIVARIEQNIPASAASVSWDAVSYAVAEQRYEIFKMGAESELKETWDCPAMEKLAPLTGAIE
tara:strand:- start:140 stop:496 length:357 start_codon:yes stop_codon:yes gene_type:complete